MFFKRKKRIIAPYERSVDMTPFQVYEIVDAEAKHTYKKNHFVSPIFGTHVKDEVVIPIMTNRKQNLDTLDSFRTKPKLTKEERKRKYGSEFPEFDLIRGKSLQEVIDRQKQSKESPGRIIKASVVDQETTTPEKPDPSPVNQVKDHFAHEKPTDTLQPQQDTDSQQESSPYQETESDAPVKHTPEPSEEGSEPRETIEDVEDHDEQPEPSPEPEQPKSFVKTNVIDSRHYQLPPISLLSKPSEEKIDLTKSIEKQINILNKTLEEFQVGGRVFKHTQGPTVTRYEIALDSGVNVKRVTGIADNIKMALAAISIRIEAPIPGKSTVGIEVPNEHVQTVHFLDIVNHSKFKQAAQPLTIGLGLDIDGNPVYASIKSMPHGLVAGATGSGKSVCINTILMSLLLRYTPSELKLMLIDPKMVELTNYNDIPHLLTPVITDSKAATAALRWVVEEMDRRFNTFSDMRVRDIDAYNDKVQDNPEEHMPYIIIVVDELSDLMMISSQHVEDSIKRLTQKARACGIHLIIATQRPSTDVIKGTIKSNIPTRIAFSVSSHVDSQTIIDSSGADKLLGRGDMLFVSNGQHKIRVQGAFIKDADIEKVTQFIREQMKPDYLFDQDTLVKNIAKSLERDELFEDVARYVAEQQEASINRISKQFGIGFNRAQSIVEALEEVSIVSENLGSKAREVLVSNEDIEEILNKLR